MADSPTSPAGRFAQRWLPGLLLGAALTATAAPIRLVSWNAQSFTNAADRSSTMDARLNSAAFQLKGQRPDIVFLQGIPDWRTAHELAGRIGEEFRVVVCSAFSTNASGEVAILSKLQSGLSWPEAWDLGDTTSESGGIAFASLRLGDQWIAVNSVDLPDTVVSLKQRENCMRQLLKHIAATGEWRTNRPSAFLFAGTLNTDEDQSIRTGESTLQLASTAGFTSAFLDLPRAQRLTLRARTQYAATTAAYVFADSGGFLAPAEVFPSILSDHALVTVEWDPAATMPAPVTEPVLALAGDASNQLFGIELKWWVAGLGGFVMVILLMLVFRRPQPAFDPGHALPSSSGKNILFLNDGETDPDRGGQPRLTERERRKLRPTMLGWLKEHFIGALVSQRQHLIDTQDSAASKADELGRRVEKMQVQLIERVKKAEQRVVELERELALSKNENRELIQSNLQLAQNDLNEARERMRAGQG